MMEEEQDNMGKVKDYLDSAYKFLADYPVFFIVPIVVIILAACIIPLEIAQRNNDYRRDARTDGQQANYLGQSVDDNPHKDANLAREWREGWIRADKEKGK